MKSLIQFLEAQNFLVKGHTKKQDDLKRLVSELIKAGVCEQPDKSYLSPAAITLGTVNRIHIYTNEINDKNGYITDNDVKQLINSSDKQPQLYFVPCKSIINSLNTHLEANYRNSSRVYDAGGNREVYIYIDSLDELIVVLKDLIDFGNDILA